MGTSEPQEDGLDGGIRMTTTFRVEKKQGRELRRAGREVGIQEMNTL